MRSETLDMNGLVIYPECIVRPFYKSHRDIILDEENEIDHKYHYQGLVISIDRNGVAVFFDIEVDGSDLRLDDQYSDRSDIQEEERVIMWDSKNWRYGPTKLLNGEFKISECPRIRYYDPQDLRIEDDWVYTDNFDRRAAGPNNHCHHHALLKIKFIRGGSPCVTPDCDGIATRLSFQNIWGIMYPVYTCITCDEQNHVLWMDVAKLKKDWKHFDHSVYPKQ